MKSFDSLATFVDHVEALPYRRGDLDTGHAGFGGGTLAEAMRLARYGWPEGALEASEKATRIASRVLESTSTEGTTIAIVADVVGAAFDVGSYLAGVPECWSRPEPQPTRRAVRIVLNAGASGGVSNDVIQRRGLAVTALALVFMARGYPVTLDVYIANRSEKKRNLLVRVADAASGSQLDVDRIVYAMAHPTMLRVLYRAHYNGWRNGKWIDCDWRSDAPDSNAKPTGDIDLFIGGAHLDDSERWRDGGEAWVLAEYNRQTQGG